MLGRRGAIGGLEPHGHQVRELRVAHGAMPGRRAIERRVVHDHDLAVGREVDVGLQEIDVERERVAEREQAVLRPELPAATVRGDERTRRGDGQRDSQNDRGEDGGRARSHATSGGMSSGRSVMMTSTPAATRRSRTAASFTVKTPTATPARCAASTTAASQSE